MTIKHATTKAPGQRLYAVEDWNANHAGLPLNHTDPGEVSGVGTKTHSQIDTHIADGSIHFPETNLVHRTGNEEIGGTKTFSSQVELPAAPPTLDVHAASKSYVDAFLAGLTWKAPVATFADLATTYPDPEPGWAALVLDESKGYTWTGAAWVQFTAMVEYTASSGVKKVGTDFQADLADTNPALEIADGGVRVKVDDSSIERAAGGLQVKALGVTNAMLAGSIEDAKLNPIATAGKVAGSALTSLNIIPAGASQVPPVNLGTGADIATKFLRGDGTWQEVAAGAVSAAEQYINVVTLASPQTFSTWTNMPAAEWEMFNNQYSRFRYNTTNVTKYRLVASQQAAGAMYAILNLQYSDNLVDWFPCDTAGAGKVSVGLGLGLKIGEWADLVAGAKGDKYFRWVGKDGDGVADPSFRQMMVQFYVPASAGLPVHGNEAHTSAFFSASAEVDHNQTTNTHNLTTDINHQSITGAGTNTHAQIDTHIGDGTIHFVEGAISHLNITNIGTNSHSAIDTHIGDVAKHSVEHAIEFVIDGGGQAITAGIKGDLEVPFKCEIQSATLLADRSGEIKIDIWVNGYDNFPPTNGDTITGGNEPEIVSGDKDQDTTLTDWTKALAKGSILRVNVDDCETIERCTLSLKVNKVV